MTWVEIADQWLALPSELRTRVTLSQLLSQTAELERQACAEIVLRMDPTNGALRVLAARIRARSDG